MNNQSCEVLAKFLWKIIIRFWKSRNCCTENINHVGTPPFQTTDRSWLQYYQSRVQCTPSTYSIFPLHLVAV